MKLNKKKKKSNDIFNIHQYHDQDSYENILLSEESINDSFSSLINAKKLLKEKDIFNMKENIFKAR